MLYLWRFEEPASAHLCPAADRIAVTRPRIINLRRTKINGEMKSISVRLVETVDRIGLASGLINERYVKKGYGASHRIPASAQHATFTAELEGEVVGTITLGVDGPRGLAAENTFQDEIDKLRSSSVVSLCELTKFAFATGFHSRQIMASLFHIVFVYGSRSFGCTDLLIEVHRKHARFYEVMLGFERCGETRVNLSVNAELQLMRISVADIRSRITAASVEKPNPAAKCLYSLFFPVTDEDGLFNRLMLSDGVANDLSAQRCRTTNQIEHAVKDVADSNSGLEPDMFSLVISSETLKRALALAPYKPDQIRASFVENEQLRRLPNESLMEDQLRAITVGEEEMPSQIGLFDRSDIPSSQ